MPRPSSQTARRLVRPKATSLPAPTASVAALAVALALLASAGLAACGKKEPPGPKALDCEALQRRAEQCEGAILELVRRRYEVEKVTAGATPAQAREAYLGFKVRFQRRLRDRKLETECRDLGHVRDRRQRQRASTLRYCFGRPDCRSFGECLLSR